MITLDLGGKWQGSCVGRELSFEASVPGCVHRDLINAGVLVRNIFFRDNADSVQWIENEDWEYEKSFKLEDIKPGAFLVFECLDTYADIYLNGKFVGEADDMFITHRFSVDGLLNTGINTLKVIFHSPVARTKACPDKPHAFTNERLYTRRMQCTYGWDWTARFVTCGISRPCRLEFDSTPAVSNAYIYTDIIDSLGAQLVCDTEFKNINGGFSYTLCILDPNKNTVYENTRFCREEHHREYICINKPYLWNPLNCGEQNLYTLNITVNDGVYSTRFGIRSVRILKKTDAPGSEYYNLCKELQNTQSGREYDFNTEFESFNVVVNGKRVFCKGADWAPCEPFVSDVTDEKLTAILELAAGAGVNIIRVWGGGMFEKEHFYNECDRLGIMVTQDFLMACGYYPEDDPRFRRALSKETEFAAYYLRNHPCLIWYTGDNENAVNGNDRMSEFPGRTAAFTVAAPILARLDPNRLFLPSSPCGGDRYASKTVGTTHNTQFLATFFDYIVNRDMSDYKEIYKEFNARFIAEEPSLGAVCTPSLLRIMNKDELNPGGEMWLYHTKTNPGLPKQIFEYAYIFARKLFGDFKDEADGIFKLQYLQYEWMRVSFEQARRNMYFCGGIMYWMLADCWPAASGWSIIDYFLMPKASYYCFKRCAKSVMLSLDGKNVYVCNDSYKDETVGINLKLLDLRTGKISKEESFTLNVGANTVESHAYGLQLKKHEMLLCESDTDRTFYKPGALKLVSCPLTYTVTENTVSLYCDTYVHAVRLEGGCIFSDNYFSLYPGQTACVAYKKAPGFDFGTVTVTGYTVEI